jgi:hypothetical protein
MAPSMLLQVLLVEQLPAIRVTVLRKFVWGMRSGFPHFLMTLGLLNY